MPLLALVPLTWATICGVVTVVLGGLVHAVFRLGRLTQQVDELEKKIDHLLKRLGE